MMFIFFSSIPHNKKIIINKGQSDLFCCLRAVCFSSLKGFSIVQRSDLTNQSRLINFNIPRAQTLYTVYQKTVLELMSFTVAKDDTQATFIVTSGNNKTWR